MKGKDGLDHEVGQGSSRRGRNTELQKAYADGVAGVVAGHRLERGGIVGVNQKLRFSQEAFRSQNLMEKVSLPLCENLVARVGEMGQGSFQVQSLARTSVLQ